MELVFKKYWWGSHSVCHGDGRKDMGGSDKAATWIK